VNERDPVLARLGELRLLAPPPQLGRQIMASGRARLVPAKVHAVFSFGVAACVVTYLGWALHFTSQLF
jgi:hypothetical protein